ncbi:putative mitochondrial protein [Phytophthora megakarya]|uniref:Putative mitochondrial protein n=1 Tax=Phytophthora megakarya TaxID=4795 RepID=A0A225WJE0_9STRA|nr:putative mitochondrial protein [Phytophthora megakarya]
MARPPLPTLPTTVLPRHRETASPRPRTLLPHFSSLNAVSETSRPTQPEDFSKTPLEKSIDGLKRMKARVRDSFARISQTQEQFELDLEKATRIVSSLETEQRNLTEVYANLLDFSARQIQRCFRGHIGRRLFRQVLVLRAVLRVQREFREFHRRKEETRKKSRVMYRKVLRGLRGVREKSELSHAELLNRVGHNLQVEAQWRKAMGVEDTESDLITALYRKKYVRKKLGTIFRQLYLLHSIARYWESLLPQPEPTPPIIMTEQVEVVDTEEMNTLEARPASPDNQHTIVVVAPRRRPNGVDKRITRGSNRDELLIRQKLTMREIKMKKDDEIRKEEEAVKRIVQAQIPHRSTTRKGGNKFTKQR